MHECLAPYNYLSLAYTVTCEIYYNLQDKIMVFTKYVATSAELTT